MESFFKFKYNLISYFAMISGTVFMALAVTVFFEPAGVVTGGVTGIAIILKQVFGIPIWIVNAVVNIPLFIIGYRLLDRETFVKTLVCTVSLTLFLGILPKLRLDLLTEDRLVDIMLGAVAMGTGLGLIFLKHASSGGTDLLATMLNLRLRHISVPKILAIIDGVIVIAGMGVFGFDSGIYAIIAIYIITKMSDSILEGPDRAKLLYIISEQNSSISQYIVNTIHRGISYIEVTVGFTDIKRTMIILLD